MVSKHKLFVIGLLGGIASGKSHVARAFAACGVPSINADATAHEALDLPIVATKLRTIFGDTIFNSDGTIDRKQLGSIVFEETEDGKKARQKLESLVHPIVHQLALEEIAGHEASDPMPKAVTVDAPLLIEAGWLEHCDAVLFVDTPLDARIERAAKRGWTKEELERRESAQLSLDEKRRHSTHLVSGVLGEAELENFASKMLQQIPAPPE